METGCWGGRGSPRAVAPRGWMDGWIDWLIDWLISYQVYAFGRPNSSVARGDRFNDELLLCQHIWTYLRLRITARYLVFAKFGFSRQMCNKISWKSFQWGRVCACGRTDMTKPPGAFRDCANAPKNWYC